MVLRMSAPVFTSVNDPALITMIQSGAVGVLPTDTVYGLVASARNQAAIQKLYGVKKRELQPGTTIAASSDDLALLGFPEEDLARAAKYWPNSISVVMDATNIPLYLKMTRAALPARIPNVQTLLDMLRQTGPLMTTSANAPGQPTATTIDAAIDYFGDQVDFYVDIGDLGERDPSTIIGFEGTSIHVYRDGAVKLS